MSNEYSKLLEDAVSCYNYVKQDQLESQITNFKNEVDDSLVIKDYLLQSKYTQTQYNEGLGDPEKDKYIQLQLTEKLKEAREQILEATHQELKSKYDQELKVKLKENEDNFKLYSNINTGNGSRGGSNQLKNQIKQRNKENK